MLNDFGRYSDARPLAFYTTSDYVGPPTFCASESICPSSRSRTGWDSVVGATSRRRSKSTSVYRRQPSVRAEKSDNGRFKPGVCAACAALLRLARDVCRRPLSLGALTSRLPHPPAVGQGMNAQRRSRTTPAPCGMPRLLHRSAQACATGPPGRSAATDSHPERRIPRPCPSVPVPAPGLSAIAMATDLLSSTTGDGVISTRRPYNAAISAQSVLSDDAARACKAATAACTW